MFLRWLSWFFSNGGDYETGRLACQFKARALGCPLSSGNVLSSWPATVRLLSLELVSGGRLFQGDYNRLNSPYSFSASFSYTADASSGLLNTPKCF